MRIKPASSFLTELFYDSKERVLQVIIGHRIYRYYNFSRQKFYRMRHAASMGSFYARLVRGNPRHMLVAA